MVYLSTKLDIITWMSASW